MSSYMRLIYGKNLIMEIHPFSSDYFCINHDLILFKFALKHCPALYTWRGFIHKITVFFLFFVRISKTSPKAIVLLN